MTEPFIRIVSSHSTLSFLTEFFRSQGRRLPAAVARSQEAPYGLGQSIDQSRLRFTNDRSICNEHQTFARNESPRSLCFCGGSGYGGGLIASQSAVAANNCNTAGSACAYDYDNYTGLLATKAGGAGLTALPTAAKNNVASWGNDSNYYGCFYDNSNGTGAFWNITPRGSWWFNIFDRDRAESWKLNGTGC